MLVPVTSAEGLSLSFDPTEVLAVVGTEPNETRLYLPGNLHFNLPMTYDDALELLATYVPSRFIS
jgi:hypothetical protein